MTPPTREELERWAAVKGQRLGRHNYLARVALAAGERAKHGHSAACKRVRGLSGIGVREAPCTCGHDALAAVLEGK
jgi:hypothetical protein